jgi:formylglycine-generating enzyme required for sulfatase activity
MRRVRSGLLIGFLGVTVGVAAPAWADDEWKVKCAPEAVAVGPVCVDKYEASVWEIPNVAATRSLIKRVKEGRATLATLTTGGAIQRGVASDDYGAGCPDTGNGCVDFYAVSIPGVTPSAYLTWFQAAAASRNAGKRLPTNAEWQAAALGTPEGAPCIVSAGLLGPTGTAGCVSDVGAFDMVGNRWEWVADWVPRSTACPGWGGFSDDLMCLAGADATSGPGALVRGGFLILGSPPNGGVFTVDGSNTPSSAVSIIGFRAAR